MKENSISTFQNFIKSELEEKFTTINLNKVDNEEQENIISSIIDNDSNTKIDVKLTIVENYNEILEIAKKLEIDKIFIYSSYSNKSNYQNNTPYSIELFFIYQYKIFSYKIKESEAKSTFEDLYPPEEVEKTIRNLKENFSNYILENNLLKFRKGKEFQDFLEKNEANWLFYQDRNDLFEKFKKEYYEIRTDIIDNIIELGFNWTIEKDIFPQFRKKVEFIEFLNSKNINNELSNEDKEFIYAKIIEKIQAEYKK